MAEPREAVGELASFLARMEGAAEVSDAHLATATTIATGTTLEEEPGEWPAPEPAVARLVPKARRGRAWRRKSGIAVGMLLAAVYYAVPTGTDNVQVMPERTREAPPPVSTAAAPVPTVTAPVPTVMAPVAAAPTPAIVEAAPPQPSPAVSPNAALFARRGDALLEIGDISGARLLYERAAALGSGTAALSMARTFDPDFLAARHASIPADPTRAAEWYRRALAFGGNEAAAALRRLENQPPK